MTDHDPASVRPLLPDGSVDTDAMRFADEPSGRRRGLVIGGVVVGLLAVVSVGAVIAWRTIVGSAFASAEAVPADADFVMTFDLLQVRDSDQVNRLVSAFTQPAADQGYLDQGSVDLLDLIDENLEEEAGITLRDDVMPWIGRSVSFAVWFDDDLSMEMLQSAEAPPVGGVLVTGVRDGDAAADFVADLAAFGSVEVDALVERTPYAGGILTAITGDDPGEELYAWLDDDLLVMAVRRGDIDRALRARDGESILDRPDYDRIINTLPNDRLIAMYMGTEWLSQLYDDPVFGELGPLADTVRDAVDSVGGVGMAMTLRTEGVAFDLVYGFDDPDALPIRSLDASDLEFLDRLPAETLFHAAAPIQDGQIEETIQPLRELDSALYDEMAGEVEDFLGVDLFGEVLPALGREAVIAVVPTPEGLLASRGIGIGGVIAVGVEDRGPVATALDALEDFAVENGVAVVAHGSVSAIEVEGEQLFAYALGDDALAIGTGPTIVDAVINGVPSSVRDNDRYRRLDAALPGDGVPVFVDFQGIFDAAGLEGDQRALFDALQSLGAAGEISDDLVRFSMLIAIDY